MPDNANDFIKMANSRTNTVEGIIAAMDKLTRGSQDKLVKSLIDELVNELEYDEKGKVKNTVANLNVINRIDKVFKDYKRKENQKLLALILLSISQITAFNTKYYSRFVGKEKATELVDGTLKYVNAWLGVDEKGNLAEGGYLQQIVDDNTVRNQVRGTLVRAVVGGLTRRVITAQVRDFVGGTATKEGAVVAFRQRFIDDTFSQIDRVQGDQVANKLGLNYAIYEGGIIKTSRKFCRQRNGKVFTREEIAKFNPPTAKPPDYNPFTDLGGYNCRHHLNWITYELAIQLRPDLKAAA